MQEVSGSSPLSSTKIYKIAHTGDWCGQFTLRLSVADSVLGGSLPPPLPEGDAHQPNSEND